jgi:hypothetical protein
VQAFVALIAVMKVHSRDAIAKQMLSDDIRAEMEDVLRASYRRLEILPPMTWFTPSSYQLE